MNRSILLVICDFLLLSLLALARFEPLEQEPEPETPVEESASEADLLAAMRETLAAEAAEREVLAETAASTAEELVAREAALAEREQELRQRSQELEAARQEAAELASQRAALEQAKLELEQSRQDLLTRSQQEAAERRAAEARLETAREQLEAARSEQATLAANLGSTQKDAEVSRERLAELQRQLREREAALEDARREAEARAARAAEEERARRELQQRLAVVQAEAEAVRESLNLARENVEVFTAQNAAMRKQTEDLFANLERLSETQDRLAEEVAAARPKSANEIFQGHLRRTVSVRLNAAETLLLGNRNRAFEQPGLVVDLAGEVGVVFSLQGTPLNSTSLRGVDVSVKRGSSLIPARSLGRLPEDPRVGWIPLTINEQQRLGVEPAESASDPNVASEAILISSTADGTYGTVPFRLVASAPNHLGLVRGGVEKLLGDINPAREDWLYLPNGQWLGTLVTDSLGVIAQEQPPRGPAMLSLQTNPPEAIVRRWAERGDEALTRLAEAVQ